MTKVKSYMNQTPWVEAYFAFGIVYSREQMGPFLNGLLQVFSQTWAMLLKPIAS